MDLDCFIVPGQARTNLSFRPTVFTPSASFTDSHTISELLLSDSAQPTPVNLAQLFIKGIEKNSVLIDITDIKDEELLFDFNKNMDENSGYEDYCGRVPMTRKYLNRSFMETVWRKDSLGRQTILNEGVYLVDGTFIKGFPSYPADARIGKSLYTYTPPSPFF
ncbi:uncharacterized protein B0P05DRAFT_585151 [Gilbertella persicaria]|uniref:uncharacterized protein n=1 Tax=Gilbertella persicaria TaxID=101096 RepID=UPI00221F0029|nr:uncharacterized protein B0P05DRAFT_585151 [Gilbertella persicaria]KAI8086927.1 hypothetical protein B0P05DRAFT_585151 [Gilbertella persicaria]